MLVPTISGSNANISLFTPSNIGKIFVSSLQAIVHSNAPHKLKNAKIVAQKYKNINTSTFLSALYDFTWAFAIAKTFQVNV